MKLTRFPLALGIATNLTLVAVAPATPAEEGFWQKGDLKGKVRAIHFERQYENDKNDRTQSALGIELNYASAMLGDVIGFDISGYHMQKIASSGFETSDIITKDNRGDMDNGFSNIGQASIK